VDPRYDPVPSPPRLKLASPRGVRFRRADLRNDMSRDFSPRCEVARKQVQERDFPEHGRDLRERSHICEAAFPLPPLTAPAARGLPCRFVGQGVLISYIQMRLNVGVKPRDRRHHRASSFLEIAMTVLAKMIAAVTPEPSDEKMQVARTKARAAAGEKGWLSLVLDHHLEIESCFSAVKKASSATARRKAQKRLSLILTGHSIAEESVIYPAMALTDQTAHSTELYTEQSAAKVQMAALENMDPMSEDYLAKLEHIRGAVAHHVYEEESECFVTLRQTADPVMQSHLTRRYKEEFEKYVGTDL
jgi:hypothetical protein